MIIFLVLRDFNVCLVGNAWLEGLVIYGKIKHKRLSNIKSDKFRIITHQLKLQHHVKDALEVTAKVKQPASRFFLLLPLAIKMWCFLG